MSLSVNSVCVAIQRVKNHVLHIATTMIPPSNCVQTLPANNKGRDFVVGDLHGNIDLLFAALHQVDFNPAADRVLSVGNLINKGPKSYETLKLLEKPWFHAVRGSEETLAVAWLTKNPEWGEDPMTFLLQGGNWIHQHTADEKAHMVRLLEQMPAALSVSHPLEDYRVVHALWSPVLSEPRPVASWRLWDAFWNKSLALDGAQIVQQAGVRFAEHQLLAKTPTWDDFFVPGRVTYCGHTITYGVRLMHHGHLHLNGGLSHHNNTLGAQRSLVLVEHSQCFNHIQETPFFNRKNDEPN